MVNINNILHIILTKQFGCKHEEFNSVKDRWSFQRIKKIIKFLFSPSALFFYGISNDFEWFWSLYSFQCMEWTWYLANDMQFYIIAPAILFMAYR